MSHENCCEHEEHTCTYNVYAIYEGTVDNEKSTCDYDEAVKHYNEITEENREYLRKISSFYGAEEISVHLYDTVLGNMIMENTLQETEESKKEN